MTYLGLSFDASLRGIVVLTDPMDRIDSYEKIFKCFQTLSPDPLVVNESGCFNNVSPTYFYEETDVLKFESIKNCCLIDSTCRGVLVLEPGTISQTVSPQGLSWSFP